VLVAVDEVEFRDENHEGKKDVHLQSGEAPGTGETLYTG
jgi:hypothetical protein